MRQIAKAACSSTCFFASTHTTCHSDCVCSHSPPPTHLAPPLTPPTLAWSYFSRCTRSHTCQLKPIPNPPSPPTPAYPSHLCVVVLLALQGAIPRRHLRLEMVRLVVGHCQAPSQLRNLVLLGGRVVNRCGWVGIKRWWATVDMLCRCLLPCLQ